MACYSAQENGDVDCNLEYYRTHIDYPSLSEEALDLIAKMRSYPPGYHSAGVGLEAGRKNLNDFDFSRLSFEYAQFFSSSLEKANFQKSRVIGATFTSANLQMANLQEMDAKNADFSVANLCQANLDKAGLRGASLSGANLRFSSLRFANLAMVDLTRADLTGANLTGAVLVGAVIDTHSVTVEQLSKVASLYNISLIKNNNGGAALGANQIFIAPSEPHILDTNMLNILKESHPHLFEPIPLSVWYQSTEHIPEMIWHWYHSR